VSRRLAINRRSARQPSPWSALSVKTTRALSHLLRKASGVRSRLSASSLPMLQVTHWLNLATSAGLMSSSKALRLSIARNSRVFYGNFNNACAKPRSLRRKEVGSENGRGDAATRGHGDKTLLLSRRVPASPCRRVVLIACIYAAFPVIFFTSEARHATGAFCSNASNRHSLTKITDDRYCYRQ